MICIGEMEYNILVTDSLDGTFVSVDEKGSYLDEFDAKDDPFFSKMTEFIRKELDKIGKDDEDAFFKV